MDLLGMLGEGLTSVGEDWEAAEERKRKAHEEFLRTAERRHEVAQQDHQARGRIEFAHTLDQSAALETEGRAARRLLDQTAAEQEDIERRALSLPVHLQDAFIANGGRVVSPRELMSPEELREFELETLRQELGVRGTHQVDQLDRELGVRRKHTPAAAAPADDPGLPTSVRARLADLASRFTPGQRSEAMGELRASLPELYQAYPQLDQHRVMQQFNAMFGTQDVRSELEGNEDDWLYGGATPPPARTPAARPGAGGGPPAPAQTPVTPAALPRPSGGPDPIAQAEQLLIAIRQEQDPARQAQLRQQLAQVRQQIGTHLANAARAGGR